MKNYSAHFWKPEIVRSGGVGFTTSSTSWNGLFCCYLERAKMKSHNNKLSFELNPDFSRLIKDAKGGSLNNNPRDISDENLIELLYKMTGLY